MLNKVWIKIKCITHILVKDRKTVQVPNPIVQPDIDPSLLLDYKLSGARKKQEDSIRKQMAIDFPKSKPLPKKNQSILNWYFNIYLGLTSRADKISNTQLQMEYRGKVPTELLPLAVSSKPKLLVENLNIVKKDPINERFDELELEIKER